MNKDPMDDFAERLEAMRAAVVANSSDFESVHAALLDVRAALVRAAESTSRFGRVASLHRQLAIIDAMTDLADYFDSVADR